MAASKNRNMEQMTIFDYVKPEIKPQIVSPRCISCKWRVFLHGHGRSGIMACGLDKEFGCKYEERHKCGTCKYFVHYVCGPGDIYNGTACTVNAPFAEDVDEGNDACGKWEEKSKP